MADSLLAFLSRAPTSWLTLFIEDPLGEAAVGVRGAALEDLDSTNREAPVTGVAAQGVGRP